MSMPMSIFRVTMKELGFTERQSLSVIEFHFLSMYAPGFWSGSFIKKHGFLRACQVAFLCFALGLGIHISIQDSNNSTAGRWMELWLFERHSLVDSILPARDASQSQGASRQRMRYVPIERRRHLWHRISVSRCWRRRDRWLETTERHTLCVCGPPTGPVVCSKKIGSTSRTSRIHH
jgi:hypothetical protein